MKPDFDINKPAINSRLQKLSAELRENVSKVDAELSILSNHVERINRADAQNKLLNDALNVVRSRTRRS